MDTLTPPFTQCYLVIVKANKETLTVKGCYVMMGSEGNVKLLHNMVTSTKLFFKVLGLPARDEERYLMLKKYLQKYLDNANILPDYKSLLKIDEVIVNLIQSGVIEDSSLPEEIKGRVMSHYNAFMEGSYSTVIVPSLEVVESPMIAEEIGGISKTKALNILPPPPLQHSIKPKNGEGIAQGNVEILLKGSEAMWKQTQLIFKTVSTLYDEITTIKKNQEIITNLLGKGRGWKRDEQTRFRCQFCESDEHGFTECKEKEPCINCSLDNHQPTKCFWIDQVCSRCGVTGHASKLHQVTENTFRMSIMEEHGIKNFPEFMAGAESVNFRVDVAGTRGGHHSGDRPRGGGQARGTAHKRQHVQQVDPWTGSSRGKSVKRGKLYKNW